MNELNRYQQIRIQTATPGQLIQMLYDGALRFMSLGLEAMEGGMIEATNHNLVRAQRIVAELQVSLDMDKGGEIASNLNQIYDYVYRRLIDANLKSLPEAVRECMTLIGELKKAWVEVLNQEKAVEIPRAAQIPLPARSLGEISRPAGASLDIAC